MERNNQDKTFLDWEEPNPLWNDKRKHLYKNAQKRMIESIVFPMMTVLFLLTRPVFNSFFPQQSISWWWIILPIFLSAVHFFFGPIKATKKYHKYIEQNRNLK